MTEATDGGGFITSPESTYVPPTPASTATTLASPIAQPPSTRPISSREESRLISTLDDQITTISSRFTRRHQEGGYTSSKRLAKDYHTLLQTLLHHSPPAKPFMITQYLIRIIGDLNEQLPALHVPSDPRGIFYVLKTLDEAVVQSIRDGGVSQTEKVRLRMELQRGRGFVGLAFDDYEGNYKIEESIGRVYEKSLEEMKEPFGISGGFVEDDFDGGERLQEGVMDDVDMG